MLHTLTDSGHMTWTCPCGDEMAAHISHEAVQHANGLPYHIALPKCDCGKQTFLAVPTDEHYARAATTTEDGTPTNASTEAFNRTKELARQLANAGKGPTHEDG